MLQIYIDIDKRFCMTLKIEANVSSKYSLRLGEHTSTIFIMRTFIMKTIKKVFVFIVRNVRNI